MKILVASSEVLPYSKTGGLADMVGALAKFLARAGHTVGVVTPLYRGLREKWTDLRPLDWFLEVPMGAARVAGKIWTLEPAPGLTIYFIEQPQFFAALRHQELDLFSASLGEQLSAHVGIFQRDRHDHFVRSDTHARIELREQVGEDVFVREF